MSLLVGLARYNRLSRSSRIILLLLALTLVSEFMADFLARKYQNNMIVYHVYTPIYLFIVSLYFNESVAFFKKRRMGWLIGWTGIAVAALNTVFLQKTTALNSYYLLFTGFAVISMSLYSFYTILENDNVGALNNPDFWLSLILLFFWSTTYLNWSLYEILSKKMFQIMPFVGTALLSISALTYLGFGLVFLFYPKTNNNGR